MSFSHLYFSNSGQYGSMLRSALSQTETGIEQLGRVISVMNTMLGGDGSLDAHFTEITGRFGFPDDATSRSAWNELNSAWSKISVDTDVTFVNTALNQLFNKLR